VARAVERAHFSQIHVSRQLSLFVVFKRLKNRILAPFFPFSFHEIPLCPG